MREDDWLMQFKHMATPHLREMFERELDSLPAFLSELLKRLQQSEKARAPADS